MRHESLYRTDLIEGADHIAEFIAGTDFEMFQKSEMLRSAVVQKLSIIGEAAARVSEEVRARYPQVPWPQTIAFRNLLVHADFVIDWTWSGGLPGIVAPFWGNKSPAYLPPSPATP